MTAQPLGLNAIDRGLRVDYTASANDQGQSAGAGSGLVLDRGPAANTWWVMPMGASRAVVVHKKHMTLRGTR